jgi:predicted DNA-binding transcriptional regulator AlpA
MPGTNISSYSRLLSAREAALHLGVSAAYLAKLRSQGGGPRYIKIGARVVYTPEDLAAFIASRRRASTSDDHREAA